MDMVEVQRTPVCLAMSTMASWLPSLENSSTHASPTSLQASVQVCARAPHFQANPPVAAQVERRLRNTKAVGLPKPRAYSILKAEWGRKGALRQGYMRKGGVGETRRSGCQISIAAKRRKHRRQQTTRRAVELRGSPRVRQGGLRSRHALGSKVPAWAGLGEGCVCKREERPVRALSVAAKDFPH